MIVLVRYCSNFGLLHAWLLSDALHLFSCLQAILPPSTNIPEAYSSGSGEEQVSIFCALGFGPAR